MGSEWILGRLAWGCGLDSTGSGQGPVAGCCECGDEPLGSCATELVKGSIETPGDYRGIKFTSLNPFEISTIQNTWNRCTSIILILTNSYSW
jgi:hypothetical protein